MVVTVIEIIVIIIIVIIVTIRLLVLVMLPFSLRGCSKSTLGRGRVTIIINNDH